MKKLVETMFWIENQIQLCHWQERSGYKHEILGNFYKEMIDVIDKFIETSVGYLDDEILYCDDTLFRLVNNHDVVELTDEIHTEFEKIKVLLVKKEIPALVNIIEEIQGIIMRNKYLLQKT